MGKVQGKSVVGTCDQSQGTGKGVGWFGGIFTSAKGSLSSKRVFGGLGLLIIFGAYIYALFVPITLPDCTEFLAATCASLLGVDSVVSAVRRRGDE